MPSSAAGQAGQKREADDQRDTGALKRLRTAGPAYDNDKAQLRREAVPLSVRDSGT